MSRLEEVLAQRNRDYQKPKAFKRQSHIQDVELRKQQRFERAMKFRTLNQHIVWVDLDTLYPQIYTVSDIPVIQQAVTQNSSESLLYAAQALRKMLYLDKHPPVHELSEAGLLPHIPRWIAQNTHPQLQYESVLVAGAVATCSIKYTQLMVNEGLLLSLVTAVQSQNEDIREESMWALANTASICLPTADILAEYNAAEVVIKICGLTTRENTRKNACWLMSVITKGRSLDQIYQHCLPFLSSQLLTSEDVEVLTDCCHVLTCLSEREIGRVQTLIDIGVAPRLIQLLGSAEYGVQLAALRALGNISTGTDAQAEILLRFEVLATIAGLVSSTRKQVRKEAAWILSNICAGPIDHIQAIIDLGIIPKLVSLISAQDLDLCKEACWIMYNIVLNGTPEQIKEVLDTQIVFSLCLMLSETDGQVLTIVLYCLKTLLQDARARFQHEDGINPIQILVEASGGVPNLEDLQTHMDYEVHQTASFIMDEFFSESDPSSLLEDDDVII